MPHREIVTYFSITGTTGRIAQSIAKLRNADIAAIFPQVPYSVEDLKWPDSANCRSAREMKDLNARPAMEPLTTDLASYDVVFLGYPIWWGMEPRIIDAFLETYDFKGKIIVPFATSNGSGMGAGPARIQVLTPGSTVRSARLIPGDATDDALQVWMHSMRL